MKHAFLCLLVFAVSSVVADGSLDTYHSSNSNKLVIAVRDDGVLFTFTSDGWQVQIDSCSGIGPFCVQLQGKIDSIDEALVFVIGSTGKLLQTNDEIWYELIEPPDAVSAVSRGSANAVSPVSSLLLF